MSDADFALIEPAAPIKWTERIVLDALIDRFSKPGPYEKHLDSFTIVAPAKVLTGWQAFELPGTWGVMSLADNGTLRYLRKPTSRATPSLSWNANNSTCPPLHRPLVAALLRGAVKTATRQRFEDTP